MSDGQVISYFTGMPYEIKRLQKNSYHDSGFQLSTNGKRKFLFIEEIQKLIDKHTKNKEVKMNTTTMKNRYIIGSVNKINGLFSTTSNPALHETFNIAKAEAARLANLDKDKKFVVLKVEAIASIQEVVWE